MPATTQVKDALAVLRDAGCTELTVHIHFTLASSSRSQKRAARTTPRDSSDFAWYYGPVQGPGLGAIARLRRHKRREFHLTISWFEASGRPPRGFGKLDHLRDLLGLSQIAGRDAQIWARFEFPLEKVSPLFPSIPLPEGVGIFDEITGLTGVKRGSGGRLLYEISTRQEGDRLINRVAFWEQMPVVGSFPQGALERAREISTLVLRSGRVAQ